MNANDMESEVSEWNAKTKWPASALAILSEEDVEEAQP